MQKSSKSINSVWKLLCLSAQAIPKCVRTLLKCPFLNRVRRLTSCLSKAEIRCSSSSSSSGHHQHSWLSFFHSVKATRSSFWRPGYYAWSWLHRHSKGNTTRESINAKALRPQDSSHPQSACRKPSHWSRLASAQAALLCAGTATLPQQNWRLAQTVRLWYPQQPPGQGWRWARQPPGSRRCTHAGLQHCWPVQRRRSREGNRLWKSPWRGRGIPLLHPSSLCYAMSFPGTQTVFLKEWHALKMNWSQQNVCIIWLLRLQSRNL